ncbi:MAG: sigma-70 family RNA polymerase sigma factor [Oscillospiraceae bacterium]|nr:sigma-70 family RNA polymerase sigma factor [Oscillospiraceae bacterium]
MNSIEIKRLYEKYFDTVYRICFLYMKNEADAADIVQDVFCRMIKRSPVFDSDEKAKAWLIVTASNCCKTLLKKWWYKLTEYNEAMGKEKTEMSDNSVLTAVWELDKKYSLPVYLYYYEGYKTAEIAEILNEKQSTIQTRLAKARELLRLELEE